MQFCHRLQREVAPVVEGALALPEESIRCPAWRERTVAAPSLPGTLNFSVGEQQIVMRRPQYGIIALLS
jgi:hypothetical protein